MGHEEHGGTWHMDAAQLDTQRKKGEVILKTSSTVHSTNRSSSSTRPAKLQLDRAEKSKSNPKNRTAKALSSERSMATPILWRAPAVGVCVVLMISHPMLGHPVDVVPTIAHASDDDL
ncbi:unnamed protein product [Microthlaspi erraticum]|uniref:Uncharacterized protein n=1 Tax=Microthlaspi erraticum TaxID=1685480 RepID=A0A6D2JXA9_9BRAS|nr:unnamed protein product [Microthlaspi erraticum]